jgi:hypothetical protein
MPITCAACGHPGAHATIVGEGQPDRCTGCPQCQKELDAETNGTRRTQTCRVGR